jgi:hypothetical protein
LQISQFPRLTTDIARAKRTTISVLDNLAQEIESARSMTSEAIKALEPLRDNERS